MNNFLEDLKRYFETTPRDKVLEDWAKAEEFDQCGVLVNSTFLEYYMFSQEDSNRESKIILQDKYSPNFNSGFSFI